MVSHAWRDADLPGRGAAGEFFFALTSLGRTTLQLGLLERPLAVAFLWGLGWGDLPLAMGVGLFFELFWLDMIPAGTFVPPHGGLSTVLALALSTQLDLRAPGEIPLVLALCIPPARLAARLEGWRRRRLDRDYDRLMRWAREGPAPAGDREHGAIGASSPGAIVLRAAGQTIVHHTLLCLGLLLFSLAALPLLPRPQWPLGWGHLWLAAGLGGALSLRNKRAYAVLLALLAGVTLWRWVLGAQGCCQPSWFVIIGTNCRDVFRQLVEIF